MSAQGKEEIDIKGVTMTNYGPKGTEDINLFEHGVVGGPVSEEFEDAQKFREAFEDG